MNFMKKFYFLSVMLCLFSVSIAKADLTLHVAEAGTLEDLLFAQEEEEFSEIGVLILTGSLNADDIAFLNDMSKNYTLRMLDLVDATLENNALGEAAFKSTKLIHIVLPKSLVSMGKECFHSSELISIDIPTTNLKAIPSTCFTWSASLEELIIPEGVETLGDHALVFCSSLRKLSLPSTIKHIEENAILGNLFDPWNVDIPLIEFEIKAATVPTMATAGVALGGYYREICELKVPVGTKAAYQANKYGELGSEWYGFGLIQNIEESDFSSVIEGEVNDSQISIVTLSKGVVTIQGAKSGEKASIYDVKGSLVKTLNIESDNESIELSSGLYIIKIGSVVKKFAVY